MHFSNGFVDGHAFRALGDIGVLVEDGRFWLPVDRTSVSSRSPRRTA